MNTELLIQVRDQILAHPEHFDMASFFYRPDKFYVVGDDAQEVISDLRDGFLCDTSACIAGWTLVLAGTGMERDYATDAAILLGLSQEEQSVLFYDLHWPQRFTVAIRNAEELAARAEIAAEYIDHFIATNGNVFADPQDAADFWDNADNQP